MNNNSRYEFYSIDNIFIKECEYTSKVDADFIGYLKCFNKNGDLSVTYYYFHGRLHRQDGPAVEYAYGTKMWFTNGIIHRADGPAIERSDGTNIWYVVGKEVPQEQHKLYVDLIKLKGLL